MRKLLPVLLLVVAVLSAAVVACSSPCEDLATRICGCQPAGATRDNCVSGVKNQLKSGVQQPNSDDQAYCESKLATCPDPGGDLDAGVCHALNAASGKIACGLAFDADAGVPDAGP